MQRIWRLSRLGVRTPFPVVLCLLVVYSCTSANAQIIKLSDETSFSDDAITLTFWELRIEALAEEVYVAYGMRFLGDNGTLPVLRTVPTAGGLVPRLDTTVRNEHGDGTSTDGSLIIQLKYPLRRIGLALDHPSGTEELTAAIQAFNAKAELLGTIEQIVPTRPESLTETFRPVFVGLETDHPEGISTLVISYDEMGVEQVNEILLDYVTPRIFRIYVPQIVQGAETLFTTRLQIVGRQFHANVAATFFDQKGSPLSFRFNGEDSHEFSFTLPRNSFELLAEGIGGEFKIGYAVIESNHPVTAQATYSVTHPSGGQSFEVGVHDRTPNTTQYVYVEQSPLTGMNTGIAVVNPGATRTVVSLRLLTPDGPEEMLGWPLFWVEPGSSRAFFLSELCQLPGGHVCRPEDFLAHKELRGSLHVKSVEPVVVLTMRTVNGLPSTDLPVMAE